jgi:ATP-binding cassette subfamily B protein
LVIVWKSSPRWSVVNSLLVLVRGGVPFLLLLLIKMLIDQVGIALQMPASERDFQPVIWVVVMAGGLFFLNSFSSSLSVLFREKQAHCVNDYIQNLIHTKTTRIQYSFFEDSDYQDIYYRAISDANYRPTRIFYGMVAVFQNLFTILLLGGMLFTLNWSLALLMLVVMVPVVVHRLRTSKRLYNLRRQQTEDERKVAYYNRLLTLKDYAKELRVFNLGNLFSGRFELLRNKLRIKQMELLVSRTKGELFTQTITTVAMIAFYGFIAFKTVQGEVTQGAMVMYFLALQRGYGYFQDLLAKLTALYEDSLFLRNFFEFIDLRDPEASSQRNHHFPAPLTQGIRLKGVSFKYPHNRTWILKDIEMTVKKGETIALVGANGAGKTTFIKLLCGLYEPEQGQIYFDDVNLSTIDRSSLAENVSVIFQDFMLYNTSARENVWYGNVKADPKSEAIYEATRNAGVDELFTRFPNGYETTLGNLFQGSEELSLGEWQRVALARSFFHDAQLIILDEPTSSLDAYTEARLIEHFREITRHRTAIIVSHRLSTIALADRIAVLENSILVEMGTKDELMQKKGAFYRLMSALKDSERN